MLGVNPPRPKIRIRRFVDDSTGSSTVGWLCCFAIGLALTPTYTEQRHLVGDGKGGFCALATFVEPISSSLNIGVYASLTELQNVGWCSTEELHELMHTIINECAKRSKR